MEKETVYVVVNSWQFDSGDIGEIVKVFKNYGDAQRYAISRQKNALETFKNDYPDNYNVHNDINVFEVWESDEYLYNHETVVIYTREIE